MIKHPEQHDEKSRFVQTVVLRIKRVVGITFVAELEIRTRV